jgi:hypothetical protein
VRLAVNPNVGDRVQPLTRGGIECIQAMRQYQSVEEIFLYVPDTGFDAPFFIWSSHGTSPWLEAVVCCKVQVARMKERLFAAGMQQHSRLGIIDNYLEWNTAQELEGILMGAQEVFGRLAETKLEVTKADASKAP